MELHPDWNENLTEQEEELFVRAQAAYKMSDLPELRNILLVLNKEKSADELKEANIDEEIAKLENSRADLQSKIDQLNETFPFTYAEPAPCGTSPNG
jgi:adenine-specific DNA methylase